MIGSCKRNQTQTMHRSFSTPRAVLPIMWPQRYYHFNCNLLMIGDRCLIGLNVSVCVVAGASRRGIRWQNRRCVVLRRDTLRKLRVSSCELELQLKILVQSLWQVLLAGFLPFDEKVMSELFRKIQRAEFAYPPWFVRTEIKALCSSTWNEFM